MKSAAEGPEINGKEIFKPQAENEL